MKTQGQPSGKIFVLDTNVLLHDNNALTSFDEHDVIISIHVLYEIDNFKKKDDSLGYHAREVSRKIDALQEEFNRPSSLPLGEGKGNLHVEINHTTHKKIRNQKFHDHKNGDLPILAIALHEKDRQEEAKKKGKEYKEVILVTKDVNFRTIARSFGIKAEDYEHDQKIASLSQMPAGIEKHAIAGNIIDRLYSTGYELEAPSELKKFNPNTFLELQSSLRDNHKAVARLVHKKGKIFLKKITDYKNIFGLETQNLEQKCAMDLLLDPDIHLVTLVGRAGTGKTILAIAAALHQVEKNIYKKCIVARPIVPMGNDVGYLPGTLEEKLDPWMKPIADNLDMLSHNKGKDSQNTLESLQEDGMLEIGALTFIRGRSIPNQFFIVDEAQNLTREEIKTIITRAGKGTKFVLTGDIDQIDNPYLTALNCGLVNIAVTFGPEPIAGHIVLTKGVRSELAELGAKLL